MTVRLSRREFLRGRVALPLVARVNAEACLGSVMQVCTSCVERCGARGGLRLSGLLPVVDTARCTGCGECVPACPAPLTAIRMVPSLHPGGDS